MRIIGGRLRGLGLAPLGAGDAATHLRPTSDRVRESLFNLLQNGRGPDPVPGARVLDLFAGTGALGLEALSRGAAHVTFVEDGTIARGLLRENIARAQAMGVTKLYRRDATDLGENRGKPFTLLAFGGLPAHAYLAKRRPAGFRPCIKEPQRHDPTPHKRRSARPALRARD